MLFRSVPFQVPLHLERYVEKDGIEIVDGKVRIHLGNVKSALYYTILTATSLDAVEWTPCGAAEQGQDDFEFSASGATRFYKASVRDEAE